MNPPATSPATPETPPASLLPAALLRPGALLWLWLAPVALLLLLNFQGYQLISGNMDAAQLEGARQLGLAGLANLCAGLVALALTTWARRETSQPVAALIDWAVPAMTISVQVAYLWFAFNTGERVIPRNVLAWIYPPERFLFNQFMFAMLPLAHGVLRVAGLRPGASIGRTILGSAALAAGAPVAVFLLGHALRAVPGAGWIGGMFLVTALVVLGLAMFIGVVRALMAGLQALRGRQKFAEHAAIVVVALVLPIAGLLLNRSISFPVDFQAWEVYTLVVVNAGLLLFASAQHSRRPLLSFGLLCATLPFSLYFFIVFLPYLPLAILAVVAMGLGFLILSPTLLFALQLHLLNQSRRTVPVRQLVLTGTLCGALLPGFFVTRALADRAALHAALDYVYEPALNRGELTYPASLINLRRALDSHRHYKDGLYYPLISEFYGWLVFNHLVLPDEKIARLESTFFGQSSSTPHHTRQAFFGGGSVRDRTSMPRAPALPRKVEVTQLVTATTPAGELDTTVTLTLTLANPAPARGVADEYLATLPLPAGVFVTGFRLHLNGAPVPGRIFEKKTALWVYSMIRDAERRDPALLYYRTPTELELRVFPVNAGTPATVELDFLVPAKLADFTLPAGLRDPAAVLTQLGARTPPRLARDLRTIVASGLEALALPAAAREPYLHVIVDRSRDNGFTGDLTAALRNLRTQFPDVRLVRITLAHHDVVDLIAPLTRFADAGELGATQLNRTLPRGGGFALDLALARAIRQHRDAELDRAPAGAAPPPRPIFVVLSQQAANRPLELGRTREWTDLLPGLELSALGADGSFVTHCAAPTPTAPLLRCGDSLRPATRDHPVRFAPTNPASRLEYWSPASRDWQPIPGVIESPAGSVWSRAIALQLQQQDHARSPGDASFDLKSLVTASRTSGQLLTSTSYIVVENAAQWRMLEQSEKQKLTQNAALAFRETPAPPALWLAAGLVAWLAVRRRRRERAPAIPA